MKAVIYQVRKNAKGFQFYFAKDQPIPEVAEGKVLVKVKAASINPVDYKFPGFIFRGRGVGLDVSGVVEKVGEGVEGFQVGDRVVGSTSGALAEFCICDARGIAKASDAFSFEELAAMPTAYLSSYQALKAGSFEKGMKILVIGASGGCGTAGLQLAKALGAREIVGVCSKRNEQLCLDNGANSIVDYTSQKILDVHGPESFDFVYDVATNSGGGEDYVAESQKVLKKGDSVGQGMYVALNGSPMFWIKTLMGFASKKKKLILKKPRGKDMKEILALLEKEGFHPIIDSVLPFEEEKVYEGFKKLKSRRCRGNLVFSMDKTDAE